MTAHCPGASLFPFPRVSASRPVVKETTKNEITLRYVKA